MSNDSNIQAMLTDIEKVLEAAHTIVDGMQPGERKQIKTLAQDVGTAVGREPKEVLNYVNDYAHRTSIAYVTRGKNGGLIKGTRPAKVVKTTKVKATDTDPTV